MSLPDDNVQIADIDLREFGLPVDNDDALGGKQQIRIGQPGWMKYALSHGDGLHPVQWFTSFFMHAGVGHLLGNMVFLWVFGLLVESRVGSLLFAGLYLGMGVLQNLLGQIFFLGSPDDPSLGASGAIYSIMMLGMLWTPQDNIKCFLFIFYRFFLFDVPALLFGAFYVLWDFGIALFDGFQLSSALLHITGAAVGMVVAVVVLMTKWIDFENRDLASMLREARGKQSDSSAPKVKTKQELDAEKQLKREAEQKVVSIWKSIDMHINAGQASAAIAQMRHLKQYAPKASWDDARLLKLISLEQHTKHWDEVIKLSEEYLEHFDNRADNVRLNMARILVLERNFPRKALKILGKMSLKLLEPKQQEVWKKLQAVCNQRIEEGAIELE
jgi:membrane associated rhomboid family serine protease